MPALRHFVPSQRQMTRLPVKIARERIHIALFQRRLRIRVGVLFPGEAAMKDAVAAQGDPAAPADINWFLFILLALCSFTLHSVFFYLADFSSS